MKKIKTFLRKKVVKIVVIATLAAYLITCGVTAHALPPVVDAWQGEYDFVGDYFGETKRFINDWVDYLGFGGSTTVYNLKQDTADHFGGSIYNYGSLQLGIFSVPVRGTATTPSWSELWDLAGCSNLDFSQSAWTSSSLRRILSIANSSANGHGLGAPRIVPFFVQDNRLYVHNQYASNRYTPNSLHWTDNESLRYFVMDRGSGNVLYTYNAVYVYNYLSTPSFAPSSGSSHFSAAINDKIFMRWGEMYFDDSFRDVYTGETVSSRDLGASFDDIKLIWLPYDWESNNITFPKLINNLQGNSMFADPVDSLNPIINILNQIGAKDSDVIGVDSEGNLTINGIKINFPSGGNNENNNGGGDIIVNVPDIDIPTPEVNVEVNFDDSGIISAIQSGFLSLQSQILNQTSAIVSAINNIHLDVQTEIIDYRNDLNEIKALLAGNASHTETDNNNYIYLAQRADLLKSTAQNVEIFNSPSRILVKLQNFSAELRNGAPPKLTMPTDILSGVTFNGTILTVPEPNFDTIITIDKLVDEIQSDGDGRVAFFDCRYLQPYIGIIRGFFALVLTVVFVFRFKKKFTDFLLSAG